MISWNNWKILRESAFAGPLGIGYPAPVGVVSSAGETVSDEEAILEAKKKMKKKMMDIDLNDDDDADAETGDGEVVEPSSEKDKDHDDEKSEKPDDDMDHEEDDIDHDDEHDDEDMNKEFMSKKGKKGKKKPKKEEDEFLSYLSKMMIAGRPKSVSEDMIIPDVDANGWLKSDIAAQAAADAEAAAKSE